MKDNIELIEALNGWMSVLLIQRNGLLRLQLISSLESISWNLECSIELFFINII
jgi:hypothetical protein